MKKLLSLSALMFILLGANQAQKCEKYAFFQQGTVVSFTEYDGKGTETGSRRQTITSVSSIDNGVQALCLAENTDAKGKMTRTELAFQCSGDGVSFDLKNYMPPANAFMDGMEIQAEGGFIQYPSELVVGADLQGGEMTMHILQNKIELGTTVMGIKDRKVVGKESVTTPAGTYECFVITFNMDVTTNIMGRANTITIHSKQWFEPTAGLIIKTESADKSGNIMRSSVLSGLSKK